MLGEGADNRIRWKGVVKDGCWGGSAVREVSLFQEPGQEPATAWVVDRVRQRDAAQGLRREADKPLNPRKHRTVASRATEQVSRKAHRSTPPSTNSRSVPAPISWASIDGLWHVQSLDSMKALCGRTIEATANFQPRLPMAGHACPGCSKRRAIASGTQVTSAKRGQKLRGTKPCNDCGASAEKELGFCGPCAKAKGGRRCSTCTRLYLPSRPRQRSCGKCRRAWVRIVSGGLPGLGRRS
jgi:hypothetical protein